MEEPSLKNHINNHINKTINEIGKKAIKSYSKKKVEKGFVENIIDWLTNASKCNFDFIKQHFDVNENIVKRRLYHSLIPFNPFFHDISKEKPDLYGPLWIYTSLVFIIAASGEISSYFHGDVSSDYFEQFVPISALMIYGIGIGLPFALWAIMKLFGSKPFFVSILCTYGYSFTAYIPASLVCMYPNKTLHILVIGVAVFISTSFLLVNCWQDFSKYVKSRTYFLLALIVIAQLIIYLVMVLYFFGLKDTVNEIKDKIIETGSNIANNINHVISTNSSSSSSK